MQYVPPLGATDPNASYVEGNPAAGIRGSYPTATGFESTMREICNAITGAGLTPDPNNLSQLYEAIAAMIAATASSAGEGLTDASGQIALDFPGLTEEDTINAADLVVFYQEEAEGGEAASHHRKTTFGNFAALIVGAAGIPALKSAATYYVNAESGSDSNNGLTSGTAFATLQKAVNVIAQFNLNGFNVTVNVANGTYGQVALRPLAGSGSVIFVGNAGTPNDCVIAGTTGSAIVNYECTGYVFNGFQLTSSGPNNATSDAGGGALAAGAGNLTLQNVWLGPCAGTWVSASNGAQITLAGNITVQGNLTANSWVGGSGFNAQFGGSIGSSFPTNPTLTVDGTLTVPGSFMQALTAGSLFLIFSSITGAAGVTGIRYAATGNGVIDTNGGGASYYPGSSAGVTASGGQYI